MLAAGFKGFLLQGRCLRDRKQGGGRARPVFSASHGLCSSPKHPSGSPWRCHTGLEMGLIGQEPRGFWGRPWEPVDVGEAIRDSFLSPKRPGLKPPGGSRTRAGPWKAAAEKRDQGLGPLDRVARLELWRGLRDSPPGRRRPLPKQMTGPASERPPHDVTGNMSPV